MIDLCQQGRNVLQASDVLPTDGADALQARAFPVTRAGFTVLQTMLGIGLV